MSMVKPKLTFFEVEIEFFISDAIKLSQSSFGIRPEWFNTVDVWVASSKFIVTMKDYTKQTKEATSNGVHFTFNFGWCVLKKQEDYRIEMEVTTIAIAGESVRILLWH